MLIDNSYGLLNMKDEKDKTILTHGQDNRHIQKAVQRLARGDGWSKDKEYKHVSRIPMLLFQKIGHLIAPEGRIDEKALDRWLSTDEGRPYKISNF